MIFRTEKARACGSTGFSAYSRMSAAQREFCAKCGAQILFRMDSPGDVVDVNVGTLDEPAAAAPTHHSWKSSRILWFDITDDLPRFDDEPPEPALD